MTRYSLGFALVLFLALGTVVSADQSHDYDTETGHFYPQTSGDTSGALGFTISDDDGLSFWRTFKSFGGVAVLGYPVSKRYSADGFVYQVTQRAILQGDPSTRAVRLVNALDVLGAAGRNEQLRRDRLVPVPFSESPERGMTDAQIRERRLNIIRAHPTLHAAYAAAPDPVALYGLPTSEVEDVGSAYAIRTQRSVLYQWKTATPWAAANQVTVGSAGDFAKELGLLPPAAIVPEAAPAPARGVSSRGGRDLGVAEGVSTWYGHYFQGRAMANGELYDMYDPNLAASNIYPLGTLLRVTNTRSGDYTIVRVTDRGGFRYPNVIDLSYAAFSRIGNPDQGVISVRLEPVW